MNTDINFMISSYDDELDQEVQSYYWSCNNRFFRKVCYADGSFLQTRRIGEQDFISRIEEYYNA